MNNRKHPEYCLLGICLNYPEYFENIRHVGNIFQTDLCYRLYEILKNTEKFNAQTIADITKSAGINEADFDNVYNSLYIVEEFHVYLEHIMSAYAKRKLLSSAKELLQNKTKSIIEIRSEIMKIIDTIDTIGADDNITSYQIVHEMLNSKNKTRYIKSNIPYIDEQGGYEETDYIIVGARSSIGKTTFALNLIRQQILEKRKIGFFSLEVKPKKIMQILMAMEAQLNEYRIKMNSISPLEAEKLVNAASVFYNHNLIFGTVFDIEKIKKRFVKMIEAGAEIIYVDYLSYITGGKGKSQYEKVSYISQQLKLLAYEYNTPLVTLAQLNRSNEKEGRKPRKSDLRDSGNIEQDADIIILLSEKAVLGKTKIVLNVDIAKYRNGQCGDVEAYFEKSLRQIRFCKE